ncbi:MAG: diaminopimelate epimerase [Chlamydiia bacterium]|nr:diaminopimelate epimerase [Chlamydiia bacterium]
MHSFSKYHGTGNDFILVDDRAKTASLSEDQIKALCHRRFGVGGDGVILLAPSAIGDYRMRIFNSDGKEAEMCGNGLRCLVQFLCDLGEAKETFLIETQKRVYPCAVADGAISVDMGIPQLVKEEGGDFFIKVGVPHCVTFTDDLSRFDLEARNKFSKLHVNINYAMISPLQTIQMRTFERGVEEETFSCGSGGTAVCMAAWKRFGLSGPVTVQFGSGEALKYDVQVKGGEVTTIMMTGAATHVFSGELPS